MKIIIQIIDMRDGKHPELHSGVTGAWELNK